MWVIIGLSVLIGYSIFMIICNVKKVIMIWLLMIEGVCL